MGKTYSFGMQVMKPGMYDLTNIQVVGNYAVQADWKDGHNTGIYSWEILRGIVGTFALSNEQLAELAQKAVQEGLL